MVIKTEKLKTAIVGCGKVGHLHARALSRAPESVFVAACGRDLARTEKFAAAYNCYDHLARVREWSLSGEPDGAGAQSGA